MKTKITYKPYAEVSFDALKSDLAKGVVVVCHTDSWLHYVEQYQKDAPFVFKHDNFLELMDVDAWDEDDESRNCFVMVSASVKRPWKLIYEWLIEKQKTGVLWCADDIAKLSDACGWKPPLLTKSPAGLFIRDVNDILVVHDPADHVLELCRDAGEFTEPHYLLACDRRLTKNQMVLIKQIDKNGTRKADLAKLRLWLGTPPSANLADIVPIHYRLIVDPRFTE